MWPSHPRKYTMHTTRSWEFVGILEEEEDGHYWKNNKMGRDFLSKAGFGKNIIVGVLDSGNNQNQNLSYISLLSK